jgi:hypothetical protein
MKVYINQHLEVGSPRKDLLSVRGPPEEDKAVVVGHDQVSVQPGIKVF